MIEWRKIQGWDYSVSNEGMVRNDHTYHYLKPMKQGKKRKQYCAVTLGGNNPKTFKVADLILQAFVGPRPPGYLALHKDDNTDNNCLSNLYWGTHRDNGKDMVANGTHNFATINEAQALEIRKRRASGEKGRNLAIEFSISEQTVCDIHKGRIWK